MTQLPLKYVHRFRDRHGKVRHYFRQRGFKKIPLPGLPGSEEFMLAYQAALGGQTAPIEIGANRTLPGTINALVVSCYRSAEWNALAPNTQKNRRPVIERFRAANGNRRVASLHRDHVLSMLAEIDKPFMKRHWLKTLLSQRWLPDRS